MKKLILSIALLSLVACASNNPQKIADKRAEIDAMAAATLKGLLKESSGAKRLYDESYAYAVFSNVKVSLFLTGGGGKGVSVVKASGKRTYMNMGLGGLNLGLGAHKYQVVFLFESEKVFEDFVEYGWTADASASAVAGVKGANAGTTFTHGMAIYSITDVGLMLTADITGTKYWKSKTLN
ncbi:MAG: hypothetical protein IH927_06540 [Proteobacteria bacterium]|nr:hypothetical protein [Pseudomonadota bacterium]